MSLTASYSPSAAVLRPNAAGRQALTAGRPTRAGQFRAGARDTARQGRQAAIKPRVSASGSPTTVHRRVGATHRSGTRPWLGLVGEVVFVLAWAAMIPGLLWLGGMAGM